MSPAELETPTANDGFDERYWVTLNGENQFTVELSVVGSKPEV
jgi:hypothetical protein